MPCEHQQRRRLVLGASSSVPPWRCIAFPAAACPSPPPRRPCLPVLARPAPQKLLAPESEDEGEGMWEDGGFDDMDILYEFFRYM